MQENREQGTETFVIEGRNAVLEAFRSGRTIDKIYVLDGCQDGPVRTIVREAKKHSSLLLVCSRCHKCNKRMLLMSGFSFCR